MKKILSFFAATLMAANVFGYTLTIDFYDDTKLTSTNGTSLTSSNYAQFVSVPTGQTNTSIVTGVTANGTVQFGKNGGLTVGTSSANSNSVSFTLGSGVVITKCTVYAMKYESGRWLLNTVAADNQSTATYPAKGSEIDAVTTPLVWDNLNATSLAFTKDNGSGSNQKRLTILKIVCLYTLNGEAGSNDVEPTITKTDKIIAVGENLDVTTMFNSNSEGTITYTVTSTPDDAAYTFTSPNFSATTIGEYVVTASQAAATGYLAGEKTAKITVLPAERPSNETLTVTTAGYTYFDVPTEPEASYAQPSSGTTTKVDGIFTINANKGIEGNEGSDPRFDDVYFRMYNKNKLVVSVPDGCTLSSIQFTEPSSNKSWGGGISANNGFYDANSKKWYATSDVTSVEFSFTATNRIGGFILKAYDPTAVTLNAAGFATFSAAEAVEISGATVYKAAVAGSTITLTSVTGSIPANTGVILYGTAGANVTVTSAVADAGDFTGNALLASGNGTVATPANTYVLNGNQFLHYTGATLAANKAYLTHEALAPMTIVFNEEITGVEDVIATELDWTKPVFNILGQQVAEGTTGILIQNGVKFIVK